MNSSEASFSQDNTMWTSLDRIFAINEPPVYHLLTCNPYTLRQTVKKCLEKRKHKHRSHLSKTVNKQHTDVTMERRHMIYSRLHSSFLHITGSLGKRNMDICHRLCQRILSFLTRQTLRSQICLSWPPYWISAATISGENMGCSSLLKEC